MQANTHEMMLPSLQQYEIGTSEVDRCRGSIFGPWSPCERLTAALAGRGAPLGVGVVGQTFPKEDFHPLFFARLPGTRRFRSGTDDISFPLSWRRFQKAAVLAPPPTCEFDVAF